MKSIIITEGPDDQSKILFISIIYIFFFKFVLILYYLTFLFFSYEEESEYYRGPRKKSVHERLTLPKRAKNLRPEPEPNYSSEEEYDEEDIVCCSIGIRSSPRGTWASRPRTASRK